MERGCRIHERPGLVGCYSVRHRETREHKKSSWKVQLLKTVRMGHQFYLLVSLAQRGPMWAHTLENNSFKGDLIFPPWMKLTPLLIFVLPDKLAGSQFQVVLAFFQTHSWRLRRLDKWRWMCLAKVSRVSGHLNDGAQQNTSPNCEFLEREEVGCVCTWWQPLHYVCSSWVCSYLNFLLLCKASLKITAKL